MIVLPSRRSVVYAAVRDEAAHAGLAVREAGQADAPKPRLLDRVRAALRARHYSRRTEDTYIAWIKRYIFFHDKRHPAEMGAPEVTRFLTSLAVDGHVAASTQNQALSALLFLYRDVLEVDLPWLDGVVRAKRPARLPIVLTRDEVRALLQRLEGVSRLMACLLYGAGLRVLECCRLRVQDIDFATNQIVVRGGKGDKDRVTMLPAIAKADLTRHLEAVPSPAPRRPRRRRGLGGVADRVASEIPERRPRVGLAVGLSRYPRLPGSAVGPAPSPSPARDRPAARREGSRARGGDRQTGQPPHAAPLVCHAPARGRPRYPHGAGTPGTPRRHHHDDLHPRLEPRARCRAQPSGPDVHAVTRPAASHGIYSEVGCRIPQPTPIWEDRPTQAQQAESEGQQLAARDPAAIWIGCINSQRFPHYADQPIQWPNSSSADKRRHPQLDHV